MKGGFYVVDLPPNITSKDQIQPARYLRSSFGSSVLTFVAGGVLDGKADPAILVGANNTHLYFGSAASTGDLAVTPLPTKFAAPLVWGYV